MSDNERTSAPASDDEREDCGVASAADGQSGGASVIKLAEFTNSNLLKINTHDKYATNTAIKKLITKALQASTAAAAAAAPPQESSGSANDAAGSANGPLLPGLLRLGKNPSNIHAFFAFDTEEHRKEAEAFLTGGAVKTRTKVWTSLPVTAGDLAVTHRAGKKRERPAVEEGGLNVCPWRGVAYSEQLKRKEAHCRDIVKQLGRARRTTPLAVCDGSLLSGVIPSPEIDGYRNNVNLTCGFTAPSAASSSGEPCVGFLSGSCMDGVEAVEPIAGVPTVHPVARSIVDQFLRHVHDPATHPALCMYRKSSHSGYWRRLHIRHNSQREVMIDVEVHGHTTPELEAAARARLVAAYVAPFAVEGDDTAWRVVSLQLHTYDGTNNSAPNDLKREILAGAATLTEHIYGLRFELSPTAFFQVNRLGLIALLGKVREVAGLTQDALLLDVCCGTGTLGLCLAKYVKRVFGVELVADAVENAKKNAIDNGVTNAEHICGRVEQVMSSKIVPEIRHYVDGPVVALLDPPRTGVHATVLSALRQQSSVNTIVYISCDQKALAHDGSLLMKDPSLSFPGQPFDLVAAFGVDLFPHTPHVEMVGLFTRTPQPVATATR